MTEQSAEAPQSVASNGVVIWKAADFKDHFPKGSLVREAVTACVWHTPEGAADATVHWFEDPRAQASTHFVVAKTGTIFQCVALDTAAYGQGVRANLRIWEGKRGEHAPWMNPKGYNYGAIGIEVAGFADSMADTLTWNQIQSCVQLRAWLGDYFPNLEHDVPHSGINRQKHDPGELPWRAIVEGAKAFAPMATSVEPRGGDFHTESHTHLEDIANQHSKMHEVAAGERRNLSQRVAALERGSGVAPTA